MPRRRRRLPWWLLALTAAAAVAVVVLLTADAEPRGPRLALPVGELPAAVRAVEGRLGGPQRYTELNVGAAGVNLFVAGDAGTETPWQYTGGRLDGPAPAVPAGVDHPAFGLDGVALDKAESVARTALAQFPTATLSRFALRRAADASVVWSVALRSSRGGLIEVTFNATGDYLTADLR